MTSPPKRRWFAFRPRTLLVVVVVLGAVLTQVAMFLAYYSFVWRTRHSDQSGKRGTLRPTAAMMAGVVKQLWDFDRLYDEVLMYG